MDANKKLEQQKQKSAQKVNRLVANAHQKIKKKAKDRELLKAKELISQLLRHGEKKQIIRICLQDAGFDLTENQLTRLIKEIRTANEKKST